MAQPKTRLTAGIDAGTIILLLMGCGFVFFGLAAAAAWVRLWLWPEEDFAYMPLLLLGMCASLFSFAGAALLWGGYWTTRETAKEESRKSQWPDKPWRWREDWADCVVVHSPWPRVIIYSVLALIANLLTWGALATFVVGFFEQDEDLQVSLAVGIFVGGFVLATSGLFIRAVTLALNARRWGKSRLELQTVPIGVGEKLVGVIQAPAKLGFCDELYLTLSCEERRFYQAKIAGQEVGDGEYYFEPQWQATRQVVDVIAAKQESEFSVPVVFDIPATAPGTRSDPDVTWKLVATTRGGWQGYEAEFEVPIFRLQRSRPLIERDFQDYRSCLIDLTLEDLVRYGQGEVICDSSSDVEFLFRKARKSTALLLQALLGVVWLIICIGINLFQVSLAMRLGFTTLGLLVLAAVASEWLTSFSITAGQSGLRFTKRVLGIGREREFRRDEIKSIEARLERRGMGTLMQECVVLETKGGKKHVLVDRLPQRAVGQAIAYRLNRFLLLPHEPTRTPPVAYQTVS